MKRLLLALLSPIIFVCVAYAQASAESIGAPQTNVLQSTLDCQRGNIEAALAPSAFDSLLMKNEGFPVEKRGNQGCCSHHRGVCGCDKWEGRLICCDGSLSPSCRC
jgi:hypothetical protein